MQRCCSYALVVCAVVILMAAPWPTRRRIAVRALGGAWTSRRRPCRQSCAPPRCPNHKRQSITTVCNSHDNDNNNDDDDGDYYIEQQERLEEDESSEPNWDGYTLYTKTNKRLVFHQGRFFETVGNKADDIVTSKARSMYVEELPVMNYDPNNKYKPNDMIPTEELFGPRRLWVDTSELVDMECRQDECDVVDDYQQKDKDENDYNDDLIASVDLQQEYEAMQNTILTCYKAWNKRDMEAAVDCFATTPKTFRYRDGTFRGTFTTKSQLAQHLARQAQLLPRASQLVVDHMAVDPIARHVTTQWHVETDNGAKVPRTSGISFYTLLDAAASSAAAASSYRSKITRGVRVSEMWIKPPTTTVVDALVSSASSRKRARTWGAPQSFASSTETLTQRPSATVSSSSSSSSSSPPFSSSSSFCSIIQDFVEAWNRRDMQAAVSCFVDNCRYQTKDLVFCDTLQGKAALRKHLETNAAILPGTARIVLDDLCLDPMNGNIGTKWHLDLGIVGGGAAAALSNTMLRGCSMYTTDPNTGLLVTGYDITEAPVKLPQSATTSVILGSAAKIFLDR